LGTGEKATDAFGFYGVITVSVLAALVLQCSPINPIKALFWSSVINGIVAVPLMVMIILLSSKRSVMGAYVERGSIRVLPSQRTPLSCCQLDQSQATKLLD
jgi:Mn2+/Fe2+ NRAMP family transporter